MRINSSGKMGIGHSSPEAKLAILGSSNDTVAEANANLCVEGAGGNGIIFGTQASSPYRSYIQSGFVSNLGTATYDLILNPEGGNVGIGTSSPTQELDIQGDENANTVLRVANNNTGSSAGAVFQIATGTAGARFVNMTNYYTSQIFDIGGSGITTLRINFDTQLFRSTSGVERMRIDSDGEVRIAGTTDRGNYKLQVNTTGVWGQGSYINGSDARWKDNVQTLECNCLDIINSLRSVSFTYNEDSGASDLTTPHLGFIAQEVEQATADHPWLSGLVTEDPEGYKSMAYQELIPILTKAIQEQQALIEVLQADVEQLKGSN
jgi:hypothetical protein